ncbi:NAD-dependent succinate-semialdehyde dehydrogenase [Subsaxibacter sp. CAU 1640]|uniref:NAD-dependent succinate-semialdehyde dehydrogenase n=1 Tax=Subsaxibacter sp. CAU 1640 TaxID=2933271 RepID=UPI00200688C3|nr:NAD-dependent succinate-semialdehyde dehydrogenase [Subsaxibacter sp. CAU 1640]MCK7591802.1 NAD-dependent succinate-semialdehyde dehydrogenase [Subsaxibacter sp. CAU 1640]
MSKSFQTINPYDNKVIKEYVFHSSTEIETILKSSAECFQKWRKSSISVRTELLNNVAELLEANKKLYAETITLEMGKPISQSISEIEKCVTLCDFYATNADNFLSDELIETDADESFISYDPLGCILGIMPWNYPFWQVMRFAIPTLTAGNTAILKHASNVTGCSVLIEELFEKAGFPKGCFQVVLANHEQIEKIITHDAVKAVSLTGSEKAGRSIAAIAGKNLKKCVLELGGNNACIVLDDADLDSYFEVMFNARMQNTGQSCIAAKRFIVTKGIYEKFMKRFKLKIKALKFGDPMETDTTISTLARIDLADILKKQVDESIEKGADLTYGNTRKNAYFEPTILENVKAGMPVFDEETFGPVAAITKAKDTQEAFELAQDSKFGLGTMIFTQDFEKIQGFIDDIQDGAFFVNELVKSDARLPFGGTKDSGYGRELSKEGIHEFVNKKTIFIKK